MSPAAVEVSLAPVDVIRPSLPASRGRIVVRAGLEVCRTDARDADNAIVLRTLVVVLLAVLLGCSEGEGMWKKCNTMGQSRAVGKGAKMQHHASERDATPCDRERCNTMRQREMQHHASELGSKQGRKIPYQIVICRAKARLTTRLHGLQHSSHLAVGAAVSEARKDLHLGL